MQSVADVPASNDSARLIFNFDLEMRSWLTSGHALMRDIANAKSGFLIDGHAVWKVHTFLVVYDALTIAYVEEETPHFAAHTKANVY
jgi:hypothetical protein